MFKKILHIIGFTSFIFGLALIGGEYVSQTLVYAQQNVPVKGFLIGAQASKTLQDDVFPYKIDIDVQGFLIGAQSGLVLQERVLKIHALTSDIELIRRSLNILETDVPAYLRQQQNKRQALFDHVNLLDRIKITMEDRVVFVNREISQLQLQDSSNRESIEQNETQFFDNLSSLQTNSAVDNFEKFIVSSQNNIEVRAYLGAMQKIQEFYTQLIDRAELLIIAIEKNRDALVEGITVTEIENIDLGIIKRGG